jgi:hypothetical protein
VIHGGQALKLRVRSPHSSPSAANAVLTTTKQRLG